VDKKLLLAFLLAASSAFGYSISVDPADLSFEAADLPGFYGYTTVQLEDGHGLPVKPGEPALPGYAVNVALPAGMEIESVEVSYGEPTEIPGTYRILPLQKPTPIGETPAAITRPDAGVYGSTAPFPGNLVHSFAAGNASGYQVGSVLFAPVQYVPATGKILVYRSIDFRLNLKSSTLDAIYPRVRLGWVDQRLRADLAAAVINPAEITPAPGIKIVSGSAPSSADVFPYLIITDATMATSAQKLADWKTKKGLNATVVTLATIEGAYTGVDTAEKVRNCVTDYFANKGSQYVCILGTNAVVPVRKFYDPSFDTLAGDGLIPCDMYYGCLDGDFNANGNGYWGEYPADNPDFMYDVYVGRIQAGDAAGLDEAVDKTLCYEGSKSASEANPYDYQHKAILGGAFLDSSTNERELMIYIRDTHLTAPTWAFTQLWDDAYPGGGVFNSAAFIAAMNGGVGVIAHASHSNSTLIGTNSGNVTATDLYNLTNHPRFPGVLYSLGCYSADTDYNAGNCAASFVNAPNGGGAGYTGNTRYGWYSRGNPANFYSAEFEKEYFNQFGVTGVYENGKTLAEHKHAMISSVSDVTYRYIYYELNLTGDPNVATASGPVHAVEVTYAAVIPTGTQSYEVQVGDGTGGNAEGALVCVWKGTEVYASGPTDAAGAISFDINPATSGTMYLTASAHNYRTFEADVTVGMNDVKLTSFTAARTPAGVALNWRVASGPGYSFNLYRRAADGLRAAAPAPATGAAPANAAFAADDAAGWVQVNTHPIRGRNPYRFLDRDVPAGVYEYKLEAFLDGEGEELGTARVSGAVPSAFALKAAPNPARSTAAVTIGLPAAADVKLALYDLSGRRVSVVVDRRMAAGDHVVTVDVAALPAGIYILRLDADAATTASRLAVVH